MEELLAVLMGIVEGLTEFLPVSSTGHLIIAGDLSGFEARVGKDAAAAFEIIIQLGAILAVVAAYPRRFTGLLRFADTRGLAGLRGLGLLAITSLPAALLALVARGAIQEHLFNKTTVSIALIVGAVWILLVERFRPPTKVENVDAITWKQALAVGLFQCLSLWPGMSRSASTILGGMIAGVDRKAATEYSFFAAVPIMIAATCYEFYKSYAILEQARFEILAIGFVVSFISAWIAVKTFIHFLGRHTLAPFAWYRLVVGGVVLWMAFSETIVQIAWESWLLLGQMAPYLLLGFVVAGVLSVCISPKFVERHLGGRGYGPVLKASLLGVPLPLCSCSVIPVATSLRRHGASRAATTSFLISTPQTGVDSIAVTYALLGTVFAVYRPLAALASGLLGGLLVLLFVRRNHDAEPTRTEVPTCCECHRSDKAAGNLFVRAMRHGLVTLPRDIGWQLLLGVFVAGAITALAPPGEWHSYLGGGIMGILLAMAIGVPIYVCDTASVPLVVGLMHLGASPGAALAFLIAGPATNAAMIAAMWKFLGPRAMALYLLTIVVSAVGGGLTLDWLFDTLNVGPHLPAEHVHHAAASVGKSSAWAIAILGVIAFSYWAKTRDNQWEERE